MAEQDLLFSSVHDAATAENKTIRDNAFQAASVGPGMVGAYANALGGGLFAQGLARMAGWKTPAQRKAETITSILKDTGGLDRNDPRNLRAIAQKLLQQGLPGEAEKFMKRAREIEVQNRTYALDVKKTDLLERQVDVQEAAEERAGLKTTSDIMVQEAYLELDWGKFEHAKFQDKAYLDIATNTQTQQNAMDDFEMAQAEIQNAFRDRDISVTELTQKLQANMFAFDKIRENIKDEQWLAEHTEAKLNNYVDRAYKLATTDNIIFENENYTYNNSIRNANLKAQTKQIELQTKLDEAKVALPAAGEYMMMTKDGDDYLVKFNPDINDYEVVKGKDGITLGLAEVEAQEYGLTADESRVYDNIFDQYKQRYYVVDKYGEGNWKEGFPEFLTWARENITGEEGLAIIEKGQGGTRAGYNNKLMAEHNNTTTSGDTVAVVVQVEDENNLEQTKGEVQVFEINKTKLAETFQVTAKTLDEVPAEIDGESNTLTNGQLLTKAQQTGDVELAELVEEQMGKSVKPLEDTKKDVVSFTYEPVKWGRAGPKKPTEAQIKSREYIFQKGKWYKKVYKDEAK